MCLLKVQVRKTALAVFSELSIKWTESKIVAAQEIYGITGNSCCPGKFSKRYGDMLTGGTSGELITGRCGGHSSEATENGDELTKSECVCPHRLLRAPLISGDP